MTTGPGFPIVSISRVSTIAKASYFIADFPFKTDARFSVGAGIGIGSSNIYFDQTYPQVAAYNNSTLAFSSAQGNGNGGWKKFKLVTTYLEIPLELRYALDPEHMDKSWKFAVGTKIGLMLSAYTKGIDATNGAGQVVGHVSEKESSKQFFSSPKFAPMVRVSKGVIGVYGQLQVNSLIQVGRGSFCIPVLLWVRSQRFVNMCREMMVCCYLCRSNSIDLIEKKNIQKAERAILVGLIDKTQTDEQSQEYLDELAFLAETAGAVTFKRFTQKLQHPDSKTFVGKGKLEEIKTYITLKDIQLVIFDDELSGSQISNIEKILDTKTIDRSDLILDIFASRAKTAQAKLQVELAQYQYLLPRLRGMWKHLERLGGGIGTRGPGETEIETDRRIVKDKIALLRRRLLEIDKQAFTQRKDRGEFIRVALVGYTNVGKSTLMNLLEAIKATYSRKTNSLPPWIRRREKVVFETTPFLLKATPLGSSGNCAAPSRGKISRVRSTRCGKRISCCTS